MPTSPATAINAFTAVLIIACPCALALSAPFTLGWATNILGRNKLYLKNGETTEHLATIDSIVFDKTGTLTIRDNAEVQFIGRELTQHELRLIHALLHENTHPIGRAVFHHIESLKIPLNGKDLSISNYNETPGLGVEAFVGNKHLKAGSATFINVDKKAILADSSAMYISINGDIPGYFAIKNRYREGLDSLLLNLKAKINTYLLSGDNEREKENLTPLFAQEANLRFNQSPQDKLDFVKQLREQGKHVLMIGDGLNDAGALRASTVGVSIAEDTSSFTPASDVIMDAGSLRYLDSVLDFSRKSLRIIHISFAISILYNIIGLAYAVTGTLSPLICAIIMPISSISVILFTTLATHYAAKRKGLKI
jgi:Cu+-exporting ATPase